MKDAREWAQGAIGQSSLPMSVEEALTGQFARCQADARRAAYERAELIVARVVDDLDQVNECAREIRALLATPPETGR